MDRIDGLSLNLEKNNIDRIKELFPEAVEEGKINFDMLRAMLGDEVDDSKEKYQFTWNGKAKSIKLAQTPSSATLRPCKDKSKYWDSTENLYIEGDNLEVLKQLQKTYYGKIKMIYIDPPYNTGNDFVYHDDFRNSIENYKEQTNQTSSSNPESNGRFHTDWLNMMYPRLMLAKNLLSDDGLIVISIDDDEEKNIRNICDEVLGEYNFVSCIVWQKIHSIKNDAKYFSENHEYALIYAKSIDCININLLPRTEEMNSRYRNIDNDPRGAWQSGDLVASGERSNGHFVIKSPKTGKCFDVPQGKHWVYSQDNLIKLVDDNQIWFGEDGNAFPRKKRFLCDVQDGRKPSTLWLSEEVGHNQTATRELKSLFDDKKYFDFPKPVLYIEQLIKILSREDSIILDFFSGSATTAHAVMKLNAEDGSNRKFIMVQLPELCSEKSEAFRAGYKNICEIGEERIRRAGEQISSEWEKEHPSDGLFSTNEKFNVDVGFKVFKLDSSNVNEWDSSLKLDEKELALRLDEVFKLDRSKEDILYEIMLKYGVFDRQVEEIELNGKTMYRVGKRYMIVCLEDRITTEDVKAIRELSPKTVIFKESGFSDDNAKINAVYNLEKYGVEEIKCI